MHLFIIFLLATHTHLDLVTPNIFNDLKLAAACIAMQVTAKSTRYMSYKFKRHVDDVSTDHFR